MGRFTVEGGARLSGTVTVSGSKNAALPVIFAALLAAGRSKIVGLPDIDDVRVALDIISEYGAVIEKREEVTYINTENAHFAAPSEALSSKIRASAYTLGASLGRFGRASLISVGGCNFSSRPIDMHLFAAREFGAEEENGELTAREPRPFSVSFKKRSVGATVNALLLASSVRGKSVIRGASEEGHINTLIDFLVSAGARIYRRGGEITVFGGELHGGEVIIPPDSIEAGSFLALSLLSGGEVGVIGVDRSELSGFLIPFESAGAELCSRDGAFYLRGELSLPVDIVAEPHPGYPTDLQPIAAPVLASFEGGSITDTVWQERFGYLSELGRMGLGYTLCGNRAEISGNVLSGAKVRALDLRGGAACLIASLFARGVSSLDNAEILHRGYERLSEKLLSLGARIKYLP